MDSTPESPLIGAATLFLLSINIVHFILEYTNTWQYRKYFGEHYTHFSYDSFVTQQKWWVLLTASLSHSSPSHLVANLMLLMVMSSEIEREAGSMKLVALYFCTGAAGWMTTLCNSYIKYPYPGWHWVSSCGASPSTYGLAFWCIVVLPSRELSFFSWFLLFTYLLTMAHSTAAKHELTSKTKWHFSWWVLVVMISFTGLFFLSNKSLNPSKFLVIYLITTLATRMWQLVYCGVSLKYPSADNPAHVGGACLGLLLGVYFCWCDGGNCDCNSLDAMQPAALICTFDVIVRYFFNM